MPDEEQITPQKDEVVFSAQYSVGKVWFAVIVLFLFPMYACIYASYHILLEGKYLLTCAMFLLSLPLLLISLDSILFGELLFYRDRVVKTWPPFGHRTIYYSRAKVVGPPQQYKWLSNGYHIRETRPGKAFVLQVPIIFVAFFFPSNTAKMIGKILDYLAQNSEDNPRIFKKASLPKEIVYLWLTHDSETN